MEGAHVVTGSLVILSIGLHLTFICHSVQRPAHSLFASSRCHGHEVSCVIDIQSGIVSLCTTTTRDVNLSHKCNSNMNGVTCRKGKSSFKATSTSCIKMIGIGI